MKRIVQFFAVAALMMLTMATQAQVTCTSGAPIVVSNADTSTTTNSYIPGYSLFNYSFSEEIILAENLEGLGSIQALQFKPASTTAGSYFTNCEVYLAMTTLNDLSSGFINDASEFELVWSGNMSYSSTDWQTLVFDAPYAYDGTSNLVVAVRRNHGSWTSGSSFASYTASAQLGRYVYQDSGPYTIGSLPSGTGTSTVAWYKVIGCADDGGDFCFRVQNVAISGITDDGFTVSWQSVGSETMWAVSVDGGDTWDNAYDTSYTYTGLNANTPYTVSVIAICSSGDSSAARTASCRTACGGSTAVPYVEDFETLATGEVPNCWQQLITSSSSASTFPAAYNYAANARNGNIYFEFESSTGQPELVAMPVMDNISSLKLSFWASMGTSYPCTLEVGVMEDTLFVPVDTVDIITFSGSSAWKANYHQYSVFFADYSGSGDRIAIRATGNTGSQYTLMLDDFEVGVADAPEVSLPATATTDINTDLVITASVGGDMSSMTYSWTSTMNDAGNAIMSNVDNVLTINYTVAGFDTVSIIASNLYGDDTATIIVHAIDLSPVDTYPYSTGFEATDDRNWQLVNGSSANVWVIDTIVNNTTSGNTSLYISNNGGASNNYTTSVLSVSYAYRAFQFDDAGEYAVGFDWRANGESNYDYLRAWIAPVSAEVTPGQLPDGSTSTYNYTNSTPAGWIDLGGKMNLQTSWQTNQSTFIITTPGTYYLMFMWCNDNSSGNSPAAAVDNITLAPLSCSAVASISLDSITDSELAFHWQPVGDESQWRVVVGDTIDVTVSDTNFSVTDLNANTPYTVSVYAICDYGDTSFATTTTYRTTCGAIATLPWTEGFEGLPTSVAPTCWTAGFSGSPRVMTSMPRTGSQHLYFSGSTATLIALPPFEADVNTLQVRLWTRPESYTSSSCGSFSVGYMTDPSDANSFVAVQTWNYSDFSDYEEKEVSMATASDSAVLIAFRHNAGSTAWYWYVDDVTVENIPACNHPDAVSATAVSASSVDVVVYGNPDASYRIYWSDGTTTDSADVNDTVYTITGLAAGTTYTISAGTICDDGSVSSLVSTSVRTQCADGGCDLVIEMVDSFGDGWNGNAIVGYSGGAEIFNATILSGSNNTFVYSMCNSETVTMLWVSGSYPSEASFTISSGGDDIATGTGSSYGNGDTVAVVVGCPSCMRPTDISAVAISESAIDVTLTGDATGSYRIYWTAGSAVDSADITGLTYTITGLNPSTTYTITAVTICSDGTLSQTTSTSVRTQCLGGGCDVEIDMEDSYGDGWNGAAINVYVNSVLVASATIDDDYVNTFTYGICHGDTVDLIWQTGNFDDETSFSISIGGEEILTNVTGDNYTTGAILSHTVGCPSCTKPSNLVVSAITETSATVTWTAGGTETEWQVSLNSGAPVTVATNSYTFSGLTALTNYMVSVVAICSPSESSYALTGNFSTAMCSGATEALNYDTSMTSTTSLYSPIGYSLYNYSYVQTIIDSADLVSLAGDITAFAFNVGTFVSNASTMYNNMTVYMANVSETNLSSGFIHPDSNHTFTKVIDSASFNYTEEGWQIHSFDNPFTWDGHSNLLVSVKRDNGTYSGSQTFIAHTASASKMRYVYQDSGPYDPNTVSSGTASTTVGDIRLISCGAGCPMPNNLTLTSTYNSITATWQDADYAEVAIVPGLWNGEDGVTTQIVTTQNSNFSGLQPNTQYTVAVRHLCDDGMTSGWALSTIYTEDLPCFTPGTPVVSNPTYEGATVAWVPVGNETAWEVNVTSTAINYEDVILVNDTASLTIDGLSAGTVYNVSVRSICAEGYYSDWTDTVSFTTLECDQVTGVAASEITANSVKISWTATGATKYVVEYGNAGYSAGAGNQTVVENATQVVINGLDEQSFYDVYVSQFCTETLQSPWSAKVNFQTEAGVGIDEVENGNVALYPNPASTTVTVSGIEGEAMVTVVDMNGREVYTATASGSVTIDVNGYAKGAYFVRVTGERTTAIRKLIVK